MASAAITMRTVEVAIAPITLTNVEMAIAPPVLIGFCVDVRSWLPHRSRYF